MAKRDTSTREKHDHCTHAPHGGTWIECEDGFVEISVFEIGVSPRFRLFFFDRQEHLLTPPVQGAVSLETLRPDGGRQLFALRLQCNCLESTNDIPEPHEFTVELKLAHEGHTHTYTTRFTEDDHGHDHSGHEHGQDGHAHGDEYGTGVLGRLRGRYGHSHSIADKTDSVMESNERGIWALKISLLGLGLTALFQVIIVFFSDSVALLADTIHNFADAGTSIPLWIAFSLARRGTSRRFTYGYGKVEDIAGVVIVFIIFFSSCVAAYESIMKIIHPQPVQNLWWVAVAALAGFIGNEAVAVFRIRVGKEIGSVALIADGQHARVDGFTSLAVLIGVIGVALGVPILDPIIGVAITFAILLIVKKAAISVWTRLIDGIEPEILAEIEHAPTRVAGVSAVRDVRARWIGHRVYSDVTIEVDPNLSVREADALAKQVEESLRGHIRFLGSVVVRVCSAERRI
jgi:cation diffusion facilitator family transporter